MAAEYPRTPSFHLDGRRALVTGAGRGLGAAAALALAEAGAAVTLVSRTSAETEAVAQVIRARGGTAEALSLDITDIPAAAALIEIAPAFDILVNNAGTNRPGPFAAVSPKDYDDVFALNVRAPFFLSQAVARRLIGEGKPGSIIHMSSQMGHVGGANRSVYCATKHAIEGLTRAMAQELGPHGIRVNSICPTFIETPMTAPFLKDRAFHDFVLSKIKLGRVGRPDDVMGGVVFLASDASALMTGAALMLDGGWTSTS